MRLCHLIWSGLLCLLINTDVSQAAQAHTVCPSGIAQYVQLQIAHPDPDARPHAYYLPLGEFGHRAPFAKASAGRHSSIALIASDPADGCTAADDAQLQRGAIVLAQRGNCTFVEKAEVAVSANAAGIIIVNNSTECLELAAPNNTHAHEVASVFVASADSATGAELYASLQSQLVADVVIAYAGLQPRRLDPACIVLWALAVVTIVVASVWSGHTFEKRIRREREQHAAGAAAALEGRGQEPSAGGVSDQVNITVPTVAAFVLLASVLMFCLFFLLNKAIFYIFVAIFAYGSCVATAVCVGAGLRKVWPSSSKTAVSYAKWSITLCYADVIATLLALAVALLWLLNRRAPWVWPVQDLLGMAFMVMMLQQILLPDMRVATVFMLALFCYDIFMVFITPLFMPHGYSVMVRVAKGGSANELMPKPPLGRVMMLGYGDVVVPGLLIAMLRRFDVATDRTVWTGYMTAALGAYTAGIALTDMALALEIFGSKGQPALMYLVPCVLGVTWLLAYMRGDCAALWAGRVDDWKDHASGSDDGDVEAQAGAASADESRARGVAAASREWPVGGDEHERASLLER